MPSAFYDRELAALMARIRNEPDKSGQLHPRLHEIITRMRAAGHPIPSEARSTDMRLAEEAIERMFDNLPV